MAVKLEVSYFYDIDDRSSMFVMSEHAQIDEEDAANLGVVFDEKKSYWHFPAPKHGWGTRAFDRISASFLSKGYNIVWNLPKDANGDVINPNDVYQIGKWRISKEIETIANKLIPTHHPKLAAADILYVLESYTPKPDDDGKFTWARAQKISGLYGWLSGYDFCIRVCDLVWQDLDPAQKEALVDHELCHCTITSKGRWKMRKHDVADFYSIVQRHGDWSGDLQKMSLSLSTNANPPRASVKATTQKVVQKLEAARDNG